MDLNQQLIQIVLLSCIFVNNSHAGEYHNVLKGYTVIHLSMTCTHKKFEFKILAYSDLRVLQMLHLYVCCKYLTIINHIIGSYDKINKPLL